MWFYQMFISSQKDIKTWIKTKQKILFKLGDPKRLPCFYIFLSVIENQGIRSSKKKLFVWCFDFWKFCTFYYFNYTNRLCRIWYCSEIQKSECTSDATFNLLFWCNIWQFGYSTQLSHTAIRKAHCYGFLPFSNAMRYNNRNTHVMRHSVTQ